jgi:L-ascorbate metabolism protein UlaG (beta-lactamase superfamily)
MSEKFNKLTYLGHSAVFANSANLVVAIDPWLNSPVCPDSFKNQTKLDLIVLTHAHSDHASDAPALAIATGAKIAATYELAQIMAKEGVPQEQLVFMNKGGSSFFQNIKISLVNALHSSSYDSKAGTIYAGEACGVILDDGSNVIYHAGDTALFSDMKLIGEVYKPNIALLPIGDCFTMGPADAARAAELIGAKKVVPIHHSTFPLLTGTPQQFIEACQQRKLTQTEVCVLKAGESLSL